MLICLRMVGTNIQIQSFSGVDLLLNLNSLNSSSLILCSIIRTSPYFLPIQIFGSRGKCTFFHPSHASLDKRTERQIVRIDSCSWQLESHIQNKAGVEWSDDRSVFTALTSSSIQRRRPMKRDEVNVRMRVRGFYLSAKAKWKAINCTWSHQLFSNDNWVNLSSAAAARIVLALPSNDELFPFSLLHGGPTSLH